MKINFSELSTSLPNDKVLVFLVGEGEKLSGKAAALDKAAGGALSRAMEVADFKGKKGKYQSVMLPKTAKADYAILAGLGEIKKLNEAALENIGGGIIPLANTLRAKSVTVVVEDLKIKGISTAETAARIAQGANLRSYNFDKYFTKKTEDEKPTLGKFTVALKGSKEEIGRASCRERV